MMTDENARWPARQVAAQSLHEAGTVLRWFHEAVDDLITDMAPLVADYFDERATLRPMTGEAEAEMWERTGYRAYWDAAGELAELLRTVNEADMADLERRVAGTARALLEAGDERVSRRPEYVRGQLIIGDSCTDELNCQHCGERLPDEAVYVGARVSAFESVWCIACIEAVLDRARECRDTG